MCHCNMWLEWVRVCMNVNFHILNSQINFIGHVQCAYSFKTCRPGTWVDKCCYYFRFLLEDDGKTCQTEEG